MIEISVIIPVYNVEKYLPRCLDSVIAQADCVKEIILVNDGSTDGSPLICEEYAQKDKRIKIINQENGGAQSAIIAGVNLSSSEYLGFVDSDDYIDPDMFFKLKDKMEKTDADIVICDYYNEFDDGRKDYNVSIPLNKGKEVFDKVDGKYEVQLLPTMKDRKYVMPFRCNKLFKRALITRYLKDYNIRVGEDIGLVVPAMFSSNRIAYVQEGLYYYYQRKGSSTHFYKRSNFDGWKNLMKVIQSAANLSGYDLGTCFEDVSLSVLLTVCLYKIHISQLSKKERAKEYKVIGEDEQVKLLLKKTRIRTNWHHMIVFNLLKLRQYSLLSIVY